MKKLLWIFLVAVIFAGCEEDGGTGDEVKAKEGKLLLTLDGSTSMEYNCSFMDFFSEGHGGEVFISGMDPGNTSNMVQIGYGDWENTVDLTAKTYKTNVEADKMFFSLNIDSKYLSSSEGAVVTITITERTTTVIKGYFSGVVKDETSSSPIAGSFWSVPQAEN